MKKEISSPINESSEDLSKANPKWKDWHWQQKNRLSSSKDIRKFFPNFTEAVRPLN